MALDTKNEHLNYPCREFLRVLEFNDENEMLHHVEGGNHQYAKINTGMDKAVAYYAQQKNVHNLCNGNEETIPNYAKLESESSSNLLKIYVRGFGFEKYERSEKYLQNKNNLLNHYFTMELQQN